MAEMRMGMAGVVVTVATAGLHLLKGHPHLKSVRAQTGRRKLGQGGPAEKEGRGTAQARTERAEMAATAVALARNNPVVRRARALAAEQGAAELEALAVLEGEATQVMVVQLVSVFRTAPR